MTAISSWHFLISSPQDGPPRLAAVLPPSGTPSTNRTMCTRSASIPASNKFYVAVNGYVKGYATKKTAEGRSTLGESTIDIGRRNSGEYSGERSSGDENGSE